MFYNIKMAQNFYMTSWDLSQPTLKDPKFSKSFNRPTAVYWTERASHLRIRKDLVSLVLYYSKVSLSKDMNIIIFNAESILYFTWTLTKWELRHYKIKASSVYCLKPRPQTAFWNLFSPQLSERCLFDHVYT